MRNAQRCGALREGLALCTSILFTLSAQAVRPHTSQAFAFTYGWNAIYVEVSPEQTAAELFATWPVDHVGIYDPASFLATRQFSADWTSQGLTREAMAVWYRSAPEASTLKRVPAGSVLVTFCTNDTGFVETFRGVPAPPRTTWHVTDTNTVYNFVGFSVSQTTDIAAYLEGSPCENVKSLAYYRIVGDDSGASPQSLEVRTWNSTVSDGDVLLLPSDKISDWSGPLHVSPINGVDFGQTGMKAQLSVRNDGKTNRTVRVGLDEALNHDELFNSENLPYYIYMRNMDGAVTNALWDADENHYYGMAWYKKLAPGETWNIEFGLNRRYFQDAEMRKGLPFGALLKVTDNSPAHAKVVVPICGETSGESFSDWQNGLWIADVELGSIRMVGLKRVIESSVVNGVTVVTTNVVESSLSATTPTGGKFKMRLPIHRDRQGRTRLLQRVVAAGDVAADGTVNYRLYAGTATLPDTAKTVMRISSVCGNRGDGGEPVGLRGFG